MNDNEINPRLKKYFSSLKDSPRRDPTQADQGRAQFLAHAETMTSSQPNSSLPLFGKWFPRLSAQKSWAPALAGILLALMLALAGVGGTVYAAQDSLPNDILYPVKTFSETVQLTLETDTEDRLTLYTRFAKRRLEEIQRLMEEGENIPARALARLASDTDHMLEEAARVENENRQRTFEEIQVHLQEQFQTLNQMDEQSPADRGLTQAQAKTQEQLQQVREEINASETGPKGTPDDPGRPGGVRDHPPAGQAGEKNPDQKPESGPPENGQGKPQDPPGQDDSEKPGPPEGLNPGPPDDGENSGPPADPGRNNPPGQNK